MGDSTYITPYRDPSKQDLITRGAEKDYTLILTPWTIQNLILELVTIHFLSNDPKEAGYHFNGNIVLDKHNRIDQEKSDIYINIANSFDEKVVKKRPAIIIERGDVSYVTQTYDQNVGQDPKESLKYKQVLANLGIGVSCIATSVMHVEELVDFVSKIFLHFQGQIQKDFGFNRFRLQSVSPPQVFPEAKTHFISMASILVTYYDRWTIKGDHLKIKSVSRKLFDKLAGTSFEEQ